MARFIDGARIPDQSDNEVQSIDRLCKPLENVGPGFRLAQLIFGTPPHDFPPKLNEGFKHLLQIEYARLSVDDGEINYTERRLHRCQLVKLVEQDLRHSVALEFHHDAHSRAVRLITQIRNTIDLFVID